MKKKLLFVAKITDTKTFTPIFERQGVEVHQIEDFKEALQHALEWKPGLIVFLVPVYWESIIDFIKSVREDPEMERAGIIYIGRMIEGAELKLLKEYGVKTMAMGPVPEEEMARFMYDEFPAY